MIQRMTTCIIQDGVDKEVAVTNTLAEGWAEKDMIYKKDMQSWFT